jgi:hypothetical protein
MMRIVKQQAVVVATRMVLADAANQFMIVPLVHDHYVRVGQFKIQVDGC